MGVARWEPQASALPQEQGSVQREKQREPKLEAPWALPALKREQRQLALQVPGSTVLVEQQSAQRVARALQRPVCVPALRAVEHLREQQQARREAG
jgi:hypothetical protein